MFDNNDSFCNASLLAFLLAAPSRQAQMKTPPKAATAAIPSVVPTMALDRPIFTLLEEDVDVAEAEDVVLVEVVEDEDVLVPVDEDVADDELEVDVLVEASDDEDEVDVDVAEAVVLSSVLVVVLSARSSMSRLLRPCSDLLRSSPSRSACVLSPELGPVWHFSVIHSAFSASSGVQPAASRHVARSSTSTFSMAMQRVIIELSAHDRSDTTLAKHPLLINRGGAADVGVARSRATATLAIFFRMLKEFIVKIVLMMWSVSLPGELGKRRRIWYGLRDAGQL